MNKIFNLIWGQVRGLLVGFDSVVYGFIPILYKTMLYLANIDLVSENVPIQALIQRIYILVGVFMLFKLSFSIMNYIVNPDAFSDQSRGFTNLVRRVLTAIVLLVSIPWIFQEAYVVQGKIITSGILPRLILGETVSYENSEGNDYLEQIIDTSATDVQFLLFGPFYSLNYKSSDFTDCTPDKNNPSKYILGTSGMASSKECLEAVAKSMDEDDTVIASGVNLKNFFRYGEDATDERDFSKFSGLAAWTDSSGEFAINYYPIISTLCGGYLVFLLLSFCIDVAARIIRLLFLQILSPVAVISSIDPTSSGDRLKDWAKECFKTWFSLFLRLLVIFLIIQLVRVVTNTIYGGNNGFTVEGFGNSQGFGFFVWINVLLIIGIFTAAGKIPELIEKATGIQMSGELQLNPFKALGENVAFQKGLGLATGVGIGAIGAATGAGVGRIFSGAYEGLKGKNALDVQKNMVGGNRTMRNAISDGSRLGDRLRARATNFFGNQGALGKVEDSKVRLENEKTTITDNIQGVRDEIKNISSVGTAIGKIKDRAYSKAKESDEYRQRMAHAESYRVQARSMTDAHDREVYLNMAMEVEANAERWAHQEGAQDWLNSAEGRSDVVAYSAMQEYRSAAKQANLEAFDYNEASQIWDQEKEVTRGIANATSLIAGEEARIEAIDKEISKVDVEHRRVESSYKAVGGQSGGPREKNATARSDAGQHFGSTNFFGPMGPPPGGGPGHRP